MREFDTRRRLQKKDQLLLNQNQVKPSIDPKL